MILLARDVLDKLMEDRHGNHLGTVDDILIDVDETGARPPRVVAIEQGGVVLARRLGDRIGAIAAWIAARIGPRRGRPEVIPMAHVIDVGQKVVLSPTTHERARLMAGELVLRKVVERIPGAG